MPDVDIPLVISNLTNADYDVQAQQMEEIARIYKTSHWKASVCDVIMYLNIERAEK